MMIGHDQQMTPFDFGSKVKVTLTLKVKTVSGQ
jgi:hypothetical protein